LPSAEAMRISWATAHPLGWKNATLSYRLKQVTEFISSYQSRKDTSTWA
jgi:hypothetical protein